MDREDAARAPTLARIACLDDVEAFAFVGGALAPHRLPDVIAHVDACDACHELIAGLCEGSDQHEDVLTGTIVGGAYRIGSLFAVGGMGRVYRATDLVLGREVAVKVPRSQSPSLVRRFEREVAITASLGHPGVVPIHCAGRLDDGTPFYVMQLIDGISLETAVERATNREQRLALVSHLVTVANTMAFVHARGIAHRDLKPQNVLVGRYGETVIVDWGLAKHVEAASAPPRPAPIFATTRRGAVAMIAGRTTRPGDVFGTPVFMSPEQARGEPVDQRSDVYALGAMLQQLLTGRLPPKAAEAALAHASPELVAICKRAMQPEPAARYADCGALAAELRVATQHRFVAQARRWFR
jgi:serine/threonine protein kinase